VDKIQSGEDKVAVENIFRTRMRLCVGRLGGKQASARAMGVSPAQLYRYLSGASAPTIRPLVALCDAAGVSLDWLTGREVEALEPARRLASDDPGLINTQLLAKALAAVLDVRAGDKDEVVSLARMTARVYSALASERFERAQAITPESEVPNG
jgi:transcriptional regulator with XRE-family HTH domain